MSGASRSGRGTHHASRNLSTHASSTASAKQAREEALLLLLGHNARQHCRHPTTATAAAAGLSSDGLTAGSPGRSVGPAGKGAAPSTPADLGLREGVDGGEPDGGVALQTLQTGGGGEKEK